MITPHRFQESRGAHAPLRARVSGAVRSLRRHSAQSAGGHLRPLPPQGSAGGDRRRPSSSAKQWADDVLDTVALFAGMFLLAIDHAEAGLSVVIFAAVSLLGIRQQIARFITRRNPWA